MSDDYTYTIGYGKLSIPLYRTYARPLTNVTAVPESPFSGRSNVLFAAEVDVEVLGQNFLPAYTRGDNSSVVATDSMKNFVLRQALEFDGATLEGFVEWLGRRFLERYPQMEQLRLTAREMPFAAVAVPRGEGDQFEASNVLFSRTRDDYGVVTMEFARDAGGVEIGSHRCGRVGMQLLKVTGSAFTRFVRDDYTTLPERGDRPLYIFMDMFWTYGDVADALAADHRRYIASEQVRDVASVVFHEFVSESIQHLVHEMGTRIFERFPQMATIHFAAQNRTRDPITRSESDERIVVYSDPFPAYGSITLTMSRAG
ncbi:MAG TPA: urate oxidase [Ktedonobacterales bacterium]